MHGTQLGAPIHGDGDLNKWGLGRRRIKFLEFENLSFAEKFQRRRRRVVTAEHLVGFVTLGQESRVSNFSHVPFLYGFSLPTPYNLYSHPIPKNAIIKPFLKYDKNTPPNFFSLAPSP